MFRMFHALAFKSDLIQVLVKIESMLLVLGSVVNWVSQRVGLTRLIFLKLLVVWKMPKL